MSEQAFTRAMEEAGAIIGAAAKSIAELRIHGREATRVRLHPLDAETVIAGYHPELAMEPLEEIMGLPAVLDEECRIGWPVAEFDPPPCGHRHFKSLGGNRARRITCDREAGHFGQHSGAGEVWER